jgi:hypothetical protein
MMTPKMIAEGDTCARWYKILTFRTEVSCSFTFVWVGHLINITTSHFRDTLEKMLDSLCYIQTIRKVQ